jgi:uncharacterized membrane protein
MIKTVQYLSKERIVAFSDGVIAIIITLMILDIHFPKIAEVSTSNETWLALSNMIPSLIAYLVSFYGLGIFWINHHNFFHMVKHSDRNLLWLNLNLLFWLSLIPLPTSYLANHYASPIATTLYGTVMFMCHASFGMLFSYASRNQLVMDKYNKKRIKQIIRMIIISCVLWLTSVAVGFISTYFSYGLTLLIALLYFLPQNIEIEEEKEEQKE